MPDVAAAHFVGGADGDAAAGAGFGAEVALFLDDDDDAVAWRGRLGTGWMGDGGGRDGGGQTYRLWRRGSF